MDKLVTKLYSDYGKYINHYRSFPSILDGAKLVERRILYSLYEQARTDNFVKSAKIVGHTIAHYHPHGDISLYSSLVNIVQNGLADGQGNWGLNVGVDNCPAAAQRYTEVKSSKDVLYMAFEYIKHVNYEEIEMESEPVFIPTMLPICLIGTTTYCKGMGFGYRTVIPSYKKEDLVKRLRWILDGKKGKQPIIKPITKCNYISGDKEFKELLTKGKVKLEMSGIFNIADKKTIVIEAIPDSKSFEVIFKKFENEISVEKSLGWQDESVKTTKVKLVILRPKMLKIEAVAKKLKEILVGSISFECNLCNTSGKVVSLSIDDILLNVYTVYKKVVIAYLTSKSKYLKEKIEELNFIAKMKPHLSVEVKNNPDDIDKAIKNIASKLSCRQEKVKNIFDKYTIGRIFKIKTDNKELIAERKLVDKNLKNIVKYVWDEKYSNL